MLRVEIRACEGAVQIRIQSPLVRCYQQRARPRDDVQELARSGMILFDLVMLGVRITTG